MKKLTLVLLAALSLNLKAGSIKNFESLKVDNLQSAAFTQLGINEITIEFPFAKSNITKISEGEIGNVVMIDYCYSDFQRAAVFSQNGIDQQRFDALYAKYPDLKNQIIKYRMIGQKALSVGEASKLFHGFKIYFQPVATKEEMVKQVALLNEMVMGKSVGKSESLVNNKTSKMLSENIAEKRGRVVDTVVNIKGELKVYNFDGVELSAKVRPIYFLPDTVVSAVLNRNKKWKNMVVITDATTSMYPYIGQVLLWYKLNTMNKRVKDFYFFNDGDNKTVKQIGKTGGIYHIKAMAFDSVYKKAQYALMMGYSNRDIRENNIEAMLLAEKECGDSLSYVMIADNWATPRDMELLMSVKHPVKVIVCGAGAGVNVNYINLALKTKGSIHTIEKDITNLALIHEGEKIIIGHKSFVLKNGVFVELYEL
jgi:hypothetical protein